MMKLHKHFIDFAKEEQWLSRMAQNGYAFNGVNSFNRYFFNKIEPNYYNYKIDYRMFRNADDYKDYCTLFDDCGWKHISGSKSSGKQYFVQIDPNASTDIFSDSASKASRYRRLSKYWLSLSSVSSIYFITFLQLNKIDVNNFINIKSLYLTPGLWERSGFWFWFGLLFETPFVILRNFMWLIFLIVLMIFLYYTCKSYYLYYKYLKETEVKK